MKILKNKIKQELNIRTEKDFPIKGIEFIDINPLIKYPVFNLADICVVVGCMIIGISLIIDVIKEKKE